MEGRKTNKERITIAVCTNADGSHKLPLLVINKSLNPHCLKGVRRDQMGCMYFANKKAWMAQGVFKTWLLDFDRRMEGRTGVLILDDCSAHI